MAGTVQRFVFGPSATTLSGPHTGTVLVGRVLLSSIFLLSGVEKMFQWDVTASMMANEGMFAIAFFLAMAILFETLGGLSVLTGTYTRLGALALIVFLIPTTLVFHDFWAYEGQERQMQMIQFMKNVTILGGLTVLMGAGPGRYSVDAKLAPRAVRA